jgi:hypothetical protein
MDSVTADTGSAAIIPVWTPCRFVGCLETRRGVAARTIDGPQ